MYKYSELKDDLKHLEEFSIFEFLFPDNPIVQTFITCCSDDSYRFTMFLYKLKKEIKGFKIVSINHFKNGNRISSSNVSCFYQLPEEIKNILKFDYDFNKE